MQAQIERVGMSLDDFIREFDKQPFALINGEKILKMPTGYGPSRVIRLVFLAIQLYAMQRKLGTAFQETTFVLPGSYSSFWVTGSRIPDVMFFVGERIEAYEAEHGNHDERPLELVPDLAVEVVSPTDKYADVNNKVKAYLGDGVRIVWVIDPQNRNAVVYAAGAEPRHLSEGDMLLGGDVLPEFVLPLSDLFT